MKIRKATLKDIDKLTLLFDGYRVFYNKKSDIKSAKKFLLQRLSLSDSEIFVAENTKKQLVGFVQLYPLFSSTRMKKLWLLNDLFVCPENRGKQISVLLIDMAKKLVKKSKACGMFLETSKTNKIGNKLYLKTEFKLNVKSNYFEWNVD